MLVHPLGTRVYARALHPRVFTRTRATPGLYRLAFIRIRVHVRVGDNAVRVGVHGVFRNF